MRKYDKMYPGTGGTWQGIVNVNRWKQIEERGLKGVNPPFSVDDRFNALASAAFYRRYRLHLFAKQLRDGESIMGSKRAEYLRLFHLNLNAAKGCDKPRLP